MVSSHIKTAVRQGKKLIHATRRGQLEHVLRHRLTAAIEHQNLRSLPVQYVLDVGANRGQFSLIVRDMFPTAGIHAFEPLQGPADIYEECLATADDIMLSRVALSDSSGQQEIHVSKSDDSSSLLPISKLQETIFPGTDESHTTTIEVDTLDAHYGSERPVPGGTLLKIDTQGTELSVLAGAQQTLSAIEWVYVEASYVELYEGQNLAPEVIDFLARVGFELSGVFNTATDATGAAVQSDFLFSKAINASALANPR